MADTLEHDFDTVLFEYGADTVTLVRQANDWQTAEYLPWTATAISARGGVPHATHGRGLTSTAALRALTAKLQLVNRG